MTTWTLYCKLWLQEFACSAMTMSTLLWKEGGRRELSPVGHYCSEGGSEILGDIFPNTNFGFNGRHFIVSTMLVRTWVDWTQLTQSHLLNHL